MSKKENELKRVTSLNNDPKADDYVRVVVDDTSKKIRYSDFVTDLGVASDVVNVKTLDDLTDVNITNVADGDALIYNGSTWDNVPLSTAKTILKVIELTADYNITNSDGGSYIRNSTSSTHAIIVSADQPIGFNFRIFNAGTGQISVYADSPTVTINGVAESIELLSDQYQYAYMTKTSANAWDLAIHPQ